MALAETLDAVTEGCRQLGRDWGVERRCRRKQKRKEKSDRNQEDGQGSKASCKGLLPPDGSRANLPGDPCWACG